MVGQDADQKQPHPQVVFSGSLNCSKMNLKPRKNLFVRICNALRRRTEALIFELRYVRFRRSVRIDFCTFADGVVHTSARLADEVRRSRCCDSVTQHSPTTLSKEFYQIFHQHIQHRRGWGFWCWKPWILQLQLQSINFGDILVYADSGSTFAVDPSAPTSGVQQTRRVFKDLVARFLTDPSLDLLVPVPFDPWKVEQWTKADLLYRFQVQSNRSVLEQQVVEAGRLMIRKTDATCAFVKQWCETAADIQMISDDPSTNTESPEFIEHRHDQAIFNLLLHRIRWETGLENLIHATRLKN